jgi:hypothetical protein
MKGIQATTQLLCIPVFSSATKSLGRRSGAASTAAHMDLATGAGEELESESTDPRVVFTAAATWFIVFIVVTSATAFATASSTAFVAVALSAATFAAMALSVATFIAAALFIVSFSTVALSVAAFADVALSVATFPVVASSAAFVT